MTDGPSATGSMGRDPGSLRLARGVTVSWWYTVVAIIVIDLTMVLTWTSLVAQSGAGAVGSLLAALAGVAWTASTVPLLVGYRRHVEGMPMRWRYPLLQLALSLLLAVGLGVASGSWLVSAGPIVQSLVLLAWPRGIRLRLAGLVVVVVAGLWVIDANIVFGDAGRLESLPHWGLGITTLAMPLVSVFTLWWWDVLSALDAARMSEARLAAAHERLRLAGDVHDLQGHHLQVIALQLELAERLLHRDPEAAAEQLRAARRSVDDARQGTRDLAFRYGSVSLADELANARDLLRAAGIAAEADIPADVTRAPGAVLGPVIRETTTNVLRHGGGRHARLGLRAIDAGWRYDIANDVDPSAPRGTDGAGLDGIRRRAGEAGGRVEISDHGATFRVVVTIPSDGPAPDTEGATPR